MSFVDTQGLAFLLYDWLGAEGLADRERFAEHSRETFDAILELSAKLATDRFATHSKKSDREEPSLVDGDVRVIPEVKAALSAYAEAGLFAGSFDVALGGLQLPNLIQTASLAHFMAANVATAAFPMLAAANARLIARFGTKAQVATFAIPEIAGEALGTMCLSEPQAGSSLADIKTRAAPDGEDDLGARYRLFGNKMWISGGDHDITANIVHLVLAKVPGPDGKLEAGTGGISLFIVPKILPNGERNDVAVAGLNHKLGYRAIPNCLLNFGEGARHRPMGAAGAIGWRVGAEGEGLAIMFRMMNEARIQIGLGAAALACRGYKQSLDYARERPQGRIGRDPAAPQVPIVAHADVKRMLLAQKAFAEGSLALVLYAAKLVDDETTHPDPAVRDRAATLLGLLTPIAKSWPSEFGLAANDLAIQIHGGYGYTRDFDAEQTWRDNRLNPIHEGTHGIQAIDLVGRKILRDKGAAFDLLGEAVGAQIAASSAHAELAAYGSALAGAWSEARAVAQTLIGTGDAARATENASSFLTGFGHVVVAWLWLWQATAALESHGLDANFRRGKLQACRYFFAAELPKATPLLAFVGSLNDVAASMPQEAF